MPAENTGKKLLSGGIALAATTALVLGGTFAWTKVDEAINEKSDKSTIVPELIDEFDPETGDKNIGVANKGDVPFYVRVRLSEVLAVTDDAGADGISTASYRSAWKNLVTGQALKTDMATSTNDYGYTYPSTGEDWAPHGTDSESVFHDYFQWTMGNVDGENSYKNTDNKLNYTKDGETKQVTVPAKVDIYTYPQWINAGKPTGDIWVMDDQGYAYYMKAVEPYTASGLLLSKFDMIKKPDSLAYYYAIKVGMEVATDNDFDMLINGNASAEIAAASDMGKDLLNTISPNAGRYTELKVGRANAKVYNVGDELTADDFVIISAKDHTGTALTAAEITALNNDKSGLSISPKVLKAGTNNIVISLKGASDTIAIEVEAPDTAVATVNVQLKNSVSYKEGDTPKVEDFEFTCENAAGEPVTPTSIVITPITLVGGENTVEFTVDGVAASVKVTAAQGVIPAADTQITGTEVLGTDPQPDPDIIAHYCINILARTGKQRVAWANDDPDDYGNIALNLLIDNPTGEYTVKNAKLHVEAAGQVFDEKDASAYLAIVNDELVCSYLPTYDEIAPLATDTGYYTDNGITYDIS